MLIKEVHLWSVARTVFPLAWIITALVLFMSFLVVDSLLTGLLSEFTDDFDAQQGPGLLSGFLASVILGFFATIAWTLVAVVGAVVYNYLVAAGGGVTLSVAEQPSTIEEETGPGDDALAAAPEE
ncbi:MAG: hypothetical protein V3U35_00205 [Candidatus Neomarinimicrobiota bacterium]